MRKLGSSLAAAVLAAAVLPALVLAAPAGGSGSWDDCNFGPVVTSAGPNLVVTVGITETFSGLLSGTYAGTERDVVYADGTATFRGSGTFSGTVAGRSGTGTFRYEGAVPATGVVPTTGPGSARWVLTGSTGELASITANGTFGASFLGISGECDAGIYGGSYVGQAVATP